MKSKHRIVAKTLIALIILLTISACNGSDDPKGNEDLSTINNLPLTIANEEIDSKDFEKVIPPLEKYHDYQILNSITIRELTEEENDSFYERMEGTRPKDLKAHYKAVEFNFGDVKSILPFKSIRMFPDNKTRYLINGEEVVEKFYQILTYDEKEELRGKKKQNPDQDFIFGANYKNFKIISLLDQRYLEGGKLELLTIINGETILFKLN